jgi:hypothetical protein
MAVTPDLAKLARDHPAGDLAERTGIEVSKL